MGFSGWDLNWLKENGEICYFLQVGMCDTVTHYTNNTLVSDGASSYWVQKFCVRYLMFTKLYPRDQVSNQNVIHQAYKLKSFSVVMIINTDWFLFVLISALLALNQFPYLFSVFQDLATHQYGFSFFSSVYFGWNKIVFHLTSRVVF